MSLKLGLLEYCLVPGIIVGDIVIFATVLSSAFILKAQRFWQSRNKRSL
jgi:hypothetical protein